MLLHLQEIIPFLDAAVSLNMSPTCRATQKQRVSHSHQGIATILYQYFGRVVLTEGRDS